MKTTEWILTAYIVQIQNGTRYDVWALDAKDAKKRLASCGIDVSGFCWTYLSV